jgi:hypothetical protein
MLVEGLQLPFGVQPVNAVPVDAWQGPYNSVSEANSSIPEVVRYLTMEVSILDPIGGNKKYWYKDGITDLDLVDMEADVLTALNNEISARISGDTINYNLLTGETSNRIEADIVLQNEITGLTQTVENNYDDLSNQISGLTTIVGNNYDDLYNQLTGETQNRISGDTVNYNLITGETLDRVNAISGLQDQINNEVTGRTYNDSLLNNLITGETVERISGDLILHNEITGLTQTVFDNYTSLFNQLTGETVDRISGDTVNYNLITGETAERIAADLALHDFITGQTATIHQQNTDNTLLSPDKTKTVVFTDNDGTLHITGNVVQTGDTWETHINHLYTTGNTIILRDGAITAMSAGEYAGFLAKLYDGTNDGQLVFDNNGYARVGDVGSTQIIATREDNPTNDYLVKWSSGNTRFETIIRNTSSVPPSTDRNYLTDLQVTKLNSIESGAQVNLIEVIKLNGVTQNISGKTVDMTVQTSVVTDNTLTGVGTIGSPLTVNVSNLGVYTTGQTDILLDNKYPYSNPSGFTGNEIIITTGNTPTVGNNQLWINKAATGTTMFYNKTQIDTLLLGKVDTGLTINNHQLTSNFNIGANETGAYTSGQTNTLLTGYTLTTKRNSLTEVQTFTSNNTATISPNFDGALNNNDLFKIDSNYSGGSGVSISAYTNFPTFDMCKNVVIKNSKGSDVTYTFATIDQLYGGITYSFKFMGGSSANVILVPTTKTIDIIYTFEYTSSTTCLVSIIYKVEV